MRTFYEIHRSDAITLLLKVMKHPQVLTNLELADILEDSFPQKDRSYLVKEDDIPLGWKSLTLDTF
jgi:hypothetical protein